MSDAWLAEPLVTLTAIVVMKKSDGCSNLGTSFAGFDAQIVQIFLPKVFERLDVLVAIEDKH